MTQAQICHGDENNMTIFSIPMSSMTCNETEQVIYKVELGHPAHGEISALEDIQYEEKLFHLPLASEKKMASSIIPPKRGRKRKTGDDLKCDICGKQYARLKQLTTHKKYHSDKRPYECSVVECGKKFKFASDLSRHMRIHTNSRPYKCSYCDMAFTQCSARNHHHRLHTGEKPYKCQQCDASFIQSGSLTNHMIKHTNERNYQCEDCLNTFKSRKALLRHKKIHKPTRDYQCQYCWREYCQKYELQRHSKVCKFKDNHLQEKIDLEKVITEVTEIESRKIDEEKEEDNQDLPLNQDLNDEEMLEDNQESSKTQESNEKSSKHLVKPYLCSICGKQFNSKGNLKHHFITHNYTGGFLCEVCGKRFHHQSTLDSHVRIQHKGESPYQCSICNKMYTSSASLNNHFRVHFDDRPFACKICKKSFKVKRALHRHMNIHVQDSPLTNCEFCGKPCVDRGAKITHYKLHFNRLFQKAEVKKTNTESGAEQIQILHSILKNNRGLIKNPKCENNPSACKLTYKEQRNKWQESMFKEIVEVLGAEKKNFNTPVKLKDIPKIGIIQKDVYIEKPIMKRPPKKMKINHKRTAQIVNDEKHTEDINNSGCHGNSAINKLEKIISKNLDVSPNSEANSKTSENSLNEKKDGGMKKNLSEIKLTHIKQEAEENNKASSVNMDKCPLSENISIDNGTKGDNNIKLEIYDFIKKIDETTLQIKDDKALNSILEYSNNITKNCFETNDENSSENVETIIMGDNSSGLKVSDIGSMKVDGSFEITNDGTHGDNLTKDVLSVEHNSDMNFSSMEGLLDYSSMGENSCVSIEDNKTAEKEKPEDMVSPVTDQQGNEIDDTNRDKKTCTSLTQGNTSELIQNGLKVLRVNLTKMGKHGGIAKSYFCSECDKGFYLKRMVDKHEAKCRKDEEEKEKNFCHICDKEFSSRSGKARHIETVHPFDGAKKYACQICGQRFSQNSAKVLHMIRVHQNEKRYKCSVCKIRFNILADLKTHQEKHRSRIKKFVCQLCDGLFNRKSDYDHHIGRVHPMSRPYRCGGCMKGFKTAKEVMNHGHIERCKAATPKILKLVVVDETD